jgi:hypothetical protein
MIFGFNTDVKAGDSTYHVQTEDRGAANALIDTVVYCGGRIVHRRTGNYLDLLPLDADREAALKLRLDDQHRGVLEAIRSGELQPALPSKSQMREPLAPEQEAPAEISSSLQLSLENASSWLAGKRATLEIAVRDKAGNAVGDAKITVQIVGAAQPAEFFTTAEVDGRARVEFDMPRLSGAEPAVVIEAASAAGKGSLRFQLRPKPRAPSQN